MKRTVLLIIAFSLLLVMGCEKEKKGEHFFGYVVFEEEKVTYPEEKEHLIFGDLSREQIEEILRNIKKYGRIENGGISFEKKNEKSIFGSLETEKIDTLVFNLMGMQDHDENPDYLQSKPKLVEIYYD